MNLAFVTNGLDVGGVETSLVGLAEELDGFMTSSRRGDLSSRQLSDPAFRAEV